MERACVFPTFWQTGLKKWSVASAFELCDVAFLRVADGPGRAPDSFSEVSASLPQQQTGRACHLRDSVTCTSSGES